MRSRSRRGSSKKTMRLARAIIAPTTLTKICSQNSETGSRRRLCGSHEKQVETGKVLANMLSVNEVSAICKTTRMNKVGVGIANEYMDKIGESIGPEEIVETMDYNGITQNGYAAVYKRFQSAAKVSNKGLRIGCLPRPFRVSKTRQMLNLKLAEFILALPKRLCILDSCGIPKSLPYKILQCYLHHRALPHPLRALLFFQA